MENKVYVQLDIAGFLKALEKGGSVDSRITKSSVIGILSEHLYPKENTTVITDKSNQ